VCPNVESEGQQRATSGGAGVVRGDGGGAAVSQDGDLVRVVAAVAQSRLGFEIYWGICRRWW
jgi:hypothetical protein